MGTKCSYCQEGNKVHSKENCLACWTCDSCQMHGCDDDYVENKIHISDFGPTNKIISTELDMYYDGQYVQDEWPESHYSTLGNHHTAIIAYQLKHINIVPGTIAGVIYVLDQVAQTFVVSSASQFSFRSENPKIGFAYKGVVDHKKGLIILSFSTGAKYKLKVSYEHQDKPFMSTEMEAVVAQSLTKYKKKPKAKKATTSFNNRLLNDAKKLEQLSPGFPGESSLALQQMASDDPMACSPKHSRAFNEGYLYEYSYTTMGPDFNHVRFTKFIVLRTNDQVQALEIIKFRESTQKILKIKPMGKILSEL